MRISRLKSYYLALIITTCIVLFVINHKNKDKKLINTNNDKNKEIKVLCLILTVEKSLIRRGIPAWRTWAKYCHKTLFACNCANSSKILSKSLIKDPDEFKSALELPIWQLNITESYEMMGEKVFKVLNEAFEQYKNEFNWFLLVDDDTFIFVDNLYSFIANKSFNEPFTYGYNINRYTPIGYQSGGAGVLFTSEALKRITENIRNGACNFFNKGYGDVALGS